MGGYTKTIGWTKEADSRVKEIARGLGISFSEAVRRAVLSYGPLTEEILDQQIALKRQSAQALATEAQKLEDEAVQLEAMRDELRQSTLTRTDARDEFMQSEKAWFLKWCETNDKKPTYERAVSHLRSHYAETRKKLGIELSELASFCADVKAVEVKP